MTRRIRLGFGYNSTQTVYCGQMPKRTELVFGERVTTQGSLVLDDARIMTLPPEGDVGLRNL